MLQYKGKTTNKQCKIGEKMDINLIELQRNCKATAVVIEDKNVEELDNALVVPATHTQLNADTDTL